VFPRLIRVRSLSHDTGIGASQQAQDTE